jgi:hypothetical protein
MQTSLRGIAKKAKEDPKPGGKQHPLGIPVLGKDPCYRVPFKVIVEGLDLQISSRCEKPQERT